MPTFRGKGETAAQRLASHRPVAQAAGRGVQTAAHGARPTHSQKTFAPVTLCGIGGVHHRAQLRDDAPPAPAHLGIVYHQKQRDRSRAPKQVAITDPKTFLRSPRQDRARQGQGRRGRPIGAQGDGVAREGGALNAIAGPERLLLRTQVALYGEDLRTVGEFALEAGQSIPFVISYGPSFQPPPPAIDCFEALARTEAFWRDWSDRCPDVGACTDAVKRSLITLKTLIYAPTGGIVAAATISLPERLGGVRNWDYRYCWLRDATFTLMAFISLGYYDEARAWRDWLIRAVAGSPSQIQIMYGVGGERWLPELIVPWLPGYENSAPVRIGNDASQQRQLDSSARSSTRAGSVGNAFKVRKRSAFTALSKLKLRT
jgi:Glycosyl hydrolases family 15